MTPALADNDLVDAEHDQELLLDIHGPILTRCDFAGRRPLCRRICVRSAQDCAQAGRQKDEVPAAAPRQLPVAIQTFVGRAQHPNELMRSRDGLVDRGGSAILAIVGTAGVGKPDPGI